MGLILFQKVLTDKDRGSIMLYACSIVIKLTILCESNRVTQTGLQVS